MIILLIIRMIRISQGNSMSSVVVLHEATHSPLLNRFMEQICAKISQTSLYIDAEAVLGHLWPCPHLGLHHCGLGQIHRHKVSLDLSELPNVLLVQCSGTALCLTSATHKFIFNLYFMQWWKVAKYIYQVMY